MGNGRFTNEELRGLQKKIENHRRSLAETLERLRKQALIRPQDAGPGEVSDLSDLGSLEFDQGLSIDSIERVSREIEEADSAHAKIKSGRYGDCENCGQVIPVRRLFVLPEARFCGECQNALEENAKIHRHAGRFLS